MYDKRSEVKITDKAAQDANWRAFDIWQAGALRGSEAALKKRFWYEEKDRLEELRRESVRLR